MFHIDRPSGDNNGAIHPNGHEILKAAATLGVKPSHLAGIIYRETAGTMSPNIWGGYGRKYYGLIQFSPDARRQYGVTPNMTFGEQLNGPVIRYIKDRFARAGMRTDNASLAELYASILAGTPRKIHAADVNGSAKGAEPQLIKYGQTVCRTYGIRDDMNGNPYTPSPGSLEVRAPNAGDTRYASYHAWAVRPMGAPQALVPAPHIKPNNGGGEFKINAAERFNKSVERGPPAPG